MSKPKIHAFCAAGCAWETIHKEDFLNSYPLTPVEESVSPFSTERGYLLQHGVKYKFVIDREHFTEDVLKSLTIDVGGRLTSQASGGSSVYDNPLTPFSGGVDVFDKHFNSFEIVLGDLHPRSAGSTTYDIAYCVDGSAVKKSYWSDEDGYTVEVAYSFVENTAGILKVYRVNSGETIISLVDDYEDGDEVSY